jgi:uncharacterized protein (TIGR00730 family)
MGTIRNITLYCASSNKIAPVHQEAAAALGRAVAEQGWGLIYGGCNAGMMGIASRAAHAAGGKVIGISPQFFMDQGLRDPHCHEMVIADNMRHRKQILEDRGDALVALPGGLGTFGEIFDAFDGKYLGLHSKPIVFLNIAGHFQPLVDMIEHGIEHRFIKPKARELYYLAPTVESAVDYLRRV